MPKDDPTTTRTRIAIVLKGYPRLSETFIAQEIALLERSGLDLTLISLRHPTDKLTHPVTARIKAPVTYLPEYLLVEPWRTAKGIFAAARTPGFGVAFRWFVRDLSRDFTVNRIRRFGQACVLCAELDRDIGHIHSHFLHTPSSAARYAALMRGLRWSFSAHAKDIWTIPAWEKREKLTDADWGTTCTRVGYDHLAALSPPGEPDKMMLAYHGLDLADFPDPPELPDNSAMRDGSNPDDPIIIVSVGRAVAKKGYDTLLDALAALPRTLYWRFIHIGGGELVEDLKSQARTLGLNGNIEWRGPQPREQVITALVESDLFALACKIGDDGDRDGMPNVLLEAHAMKLPCVSTDISAIPELIEDGRSGVLVPPDDVVALAEAIAQLAADPDRRRALAEAAYRRLLDHFTIEQCNTALVQRFQQIRCD